MADEKIKGSLDVLAPGRKPHSSLCRLVWKPGDWLSNRNLLLLPSPRLCTEQKFYNEAPHCFCSKINTMYAATHRGAGEHVQHKPGLVLDKSFVLDELLRRGPQFGEKVE